jgi:2,4-dienoyl-CoA reductase-like NADH-dependent reductase (Old Yellow Enzyme family)
VTASLFDPVQLGDRRLRNRIVMAPMSQHSAGEDGAPTDWHVEHYGARARGGCGLVMLEDTAVEPAGRTSHTALGLYEETRVSAFRRVVEVCRGAGAAVGLQLAHAGRKAFRDTRTTGTGTGTGTGIGDAAGAGIGDAGGVNSGGSAERETDADGEGDRVALSASALAFADGWPIPTAADETAIARVRDSFARAARLANEAGFDAVEVHAAHGYLLHQFLSPLTNHRDDAYGGALENRARLLLEVVEAVRAQWPVGRPLLVRLPAGDGAAGGSTSGEMAEVARRCAQRGADLIDVAGGTPVLDGAPAGPAETRAFAELLREGRALPFALGGVTDGRSADELLRASGATLIAVGRPLLTNPSWAHVAAEELCV